MVCQPSVQFNNNGPGISVESFLESNPCKACSANGKNYFCSYDNVCEAELFKIQIDQTKDKAKKCHVQRQLQWDPG